MILLTSLVFFGASFVAAAINAVAGGGTFLTFPVFIFGGLTPLEANIMSTIALWPGTLASAHGYRSVLGIDMKRLAPFMMIGVLGGAAGAVLLLKTPEIVFTRMVPWLLLTATLIFTFGRRVIAWLRHSQAQAEGDLVPGWAALAWVAVMAVYGGYFGAGMGILTLAMLQLMGMSHIHQMNALKTVLTGAINAVTAIIFMFSGKVIWPLAFVMAAGGILGGYLGAKLALRISPQKVRVLVSAIGFAMTVYFFLQ